MAMGNLTPVGSRGLAHDDNAVHVRSLGIFDIPGNDLINFLITFLYNPQCVILFLARVSVVSHSDFLLLAIPQHGPA
jgi:hypothetical protein